MAVSYALRGPLTELALPGPADLPGRGHGLWEETCFEFFLGVKDAPEYWEFNLSPSGHWNVYRFTAYRQGMAEEEAFTSLPFSVRREADTLALSLELDLGKIKAADLALDAALAAVVKLRRGGVTFWALAHPGPQADFHHRDGFIITL